MAAERIGVEHSLAGLKRYRVLSDRLRLHSLDLYDQILGVGAGWWNFYLSDFSWCNKSIIDLKAWTPADKLVPSYKYVHKILKRLA